MTEIAVPLIRRPPRALALRLPLRTGVLVAAGIVAISFLSLLWSDVPAFDAQGWVNWGHQLFAHGRFSTLGYPSWKPLPLLATLPLAATSSAAPVLWLVLARAAGLAAVALAARLASRQAGPIAGALAAVSLLLGAHFLELTAGGLIEPIVLALLLGAYERHLAERPGQALVLLGLGALGRIEVMPLLGLYALWVMRTRPRWIVPVVIGVALVPLVWLGGDWIGSGSPTHGGYLAREAGAALAAKNSGHPATFVLNQALDLLIWPVLVAAAIGLVLAIVQLDWVTLSFAAGALIWTVADMVLAQMGYAGESGRFLLPAAGVVCVVAGIGAVRLIRLLPARRWRYAGAVVALAASIPFVVPRIPYLRTQLQGVSSQAAMAHQLDGMVAELRHRPYFLHHRKTIYPQYLQTRLSWDLGLSNVAVQRALARTLVFALPGSPTWRYYEGVCRDPHPTPPRVGAVGQWKVILLVPARYWAAVAEQLVKQAASN